jgi:hypothetical protein
MTTLTASEPPTLAVNTVGPPEYDIPHFRIQGVSFCWQPGRPHQADAMNAVPTLVLFCKKGQKHEGLQNVLYHLFCIDTFGIRQDIAMAQHPSLLGGTVARDRPNKRRKPSGWRTKVPPPRDGSGTADKDERIGFANYLETR